MSTITYLVDGMTCAHCVASVSAEVAKIAGVSDVDIDLETGEVMVTSLADPDEAAVRAAVEEAGYELRA